MTSYEWLTETLALSSMLHRFRDIMPRMKSSPNLGDLSNFDVELITLKVEDIVLVLYGSA